MTQVDVFVMFLEEVGALDNYIINLEQPFHSLIRRSNINQWVSGDFGWSSSPEGTEYWMSISRQWREMISALDLDSLEKE